FADPAGELVRIEVGVSAIGDVGEGAVLECEQGRVSTFCRPRWIPGTSQGTHGLEAPAAEQSHDVDVVRRLVVDGTAAARRVQLLRAARAIEEVGEVERTDHSQATVRAALD